MSSAVQLAKNLGVARKLNPDGRGAVVVVVATGVVVETGVEGGEGRCCAFSSSNCESPTC